MVQMMISLTHMNAIKLLMSVQLDKDEFQEDKSMAAFWVLNNQFQKFIDWQRFLDYNNEMTEKIFAEYTGIQYDRRMKERQMQSRESKVVSSKALDANISPVNDQVPYAEVHLTTQHNVLANVQQHTNQSKASYDTYLLEKVDINTTPD
ncbi:hypothetical protein Tco_0888721 [Tanacetum coccineum]